MPELPDVEAFKKYLDSTAINKSVEKVDVEDEGVLERSGRSFQMRMKDETLKSASRHGKYLFVELDRDETLVFHFGMTGKLKYYKEEDDAPDYVKIRFNLKNGYKLAYSCSRKLGKVDLIESVEDFLKEHEMGPDAYSDEFDWEAFKEVLEGRGGQIKTTLMNQKVMAGIGNVYSDEILFHAEVHPAAKVKELDEKELKKIFKKMKYVLEKAIGAKSKDKFPNSFLINHREEGEECPKCGGRIARKKFSGRSGYYCEKHQKK